MFLRCAESKIDWVDSSWGKRSDLTRVACRAAAARERASERQEQQGVALDFSAAGGGKQAAERFSLACAFLAWPSLLPSLLMVVIVGVLWGRGAIYIMYYERISLKIRADVILSRT